MKQEVVIGLSLAALMPLIMVVIHLLRPEITKHEIAACGVGILAGIAGQIVAQCVYYRAAKEDHEKNVANPPVS